jgi:aldose 1-epimerase
LAESTRDTCINLTNHTYFNLAGEGSGPILNQKIMINADKFTPTDNQQIPTGEIIRVESTPFDLRQMTPIGKHILSKDQQLLLANGYDHNFVLGKASSEPLSLAARACSLDSGIELTLYTTQPGLQFYSGNSLNNKIVGKQGHIYAERTGFALETQHYPDSLHHANFPSTLLKKGDLYQQKSFYHFDIC